MFISMALWFWKCLHQIWMWSLFYCDNCDTDTRWSFMTIFKCLSVEVHPDPTASFVDGLSIRAHLDSGWQRGKGSITKLIHSTIRGIATLYPVTFPAVSLYSHTPRVCQFYWSATLYHSVLVRFHSQQISPLSGFLGISFSFDCIMKLW